MNLSELDCQVSFVPVAATGYFSNLIKDYLTGAANLKPFYQFELSEAGLLDAIEGRKQFPVDRILLQQTIKRQYESLTLSTDAQSNLDLLSKPTTFTVTSAHQPNLLTGYLYFIYKIIHSVSLAKHLKSLSPEHDFVPIFYIGSEDNDLEELGHFKYAGKLYNWATTQTGAVGLMQVDNELQALLKELYTLLGPLGMHEQRLKEILQHAYAPGNTIAHATRILVNELLGYMGVLVIDAGDRNLKRAFKSIIKDEILHPKAFELVSTTSEALNRHYKVQAYTRPINFFYLKNNIRERIEKLGEEYVVLNTDLRFTKEAMQNEIENHPEYFSPNVILRGVYQESILPNICFIGGGSEVAYWMQLKAVFNHYHVFYPMIVLRQSALIMETLSVAQQEKLGLSDRAIFIPTEELINELVRKEKEEKWALPPIAAQLTTARDKMLTLYATLDKNLISSINAAFTKIEHQMEVIDHKVHRAVKKKLDVAAEQIRTFKAISFPKDSLQERYETFMPFYLSYGSHLFDTLLHNTKPFGDEFLIIKYTKQ
jgi:bacillithiol biosynthesis cysteine-adding enzyme BshC